ncbi:unnamed protein product [Ectocarpus sp. 12 AP-2014]
MAPHGAFTGIGDLQLQKIRSALLPYYFFAVLFRTPREGATGYIARKRHLGAFAMVKGRRTDQTRNISSEVLVPFFGRAPSPTRSTRWRWAVPCDARRGALRGHVHRRRCHWVPYEPSDAIHNSVVRHLHSCNIGTISRVCHQE